MGILETLVSHPTAEQLPLLRHLIALMLLFLYPFVGLLVVSTLLSLGARFRWPAVSRDLINLGLRSPAGLIFLGLIPFVSLTFLYSQVLLGTAMPIGTYLGKVIGLGILGVAALWIYKRTQHPAPGGLGLLLLLGFMFHLTAVLDLVTYPEKWEFIQGPLPFLFSIQVLVHFQVFLATGAALTGAAILFFCFQWPERELHTPDAGLPVLRKIGLGALLAGAFGLPILLVWDLYTAPSNALSPAVFTAGILGLIVVLVLFLLVLRMIAREHARQGWLVFVLSLILFGLFLSRGMSMQANANQEHTFLMAARAAEMRNELLDAREALYAASQEVDPQLGERIYKARCTACHAFEKKVVGPPYDAVLPKYGDRIDDLAGFVRNPKRVDTRYPPMPNQGLRRAEARAVAEYLLRRFGVDLPEPERQAGEGEAH